MTKRKFKNMHKDNYKIDKSLKGAKAQNLADK